MSSYAVSNPLVPALLAADGHGEAPPEMPRFTAPVTPTPGGLIVGLVELRAIPGGRGPCGGNVYVPWPTAVPTPPALAGRSTAVTQLTAVEIALQREPAAADLILVLLPPDGRPHICTPATAPAWSIPIAPVTGAWWADSPPR